MRPSNTGITVMGVLLGCYGCTTRQATYNAGMFQEFLTKLQQQTSLDAAIDHQVIEAAGLSLCTGHSGISQSRMQDWVAALPQAKLSQAIQSLFPADEMSALAPQLACRDLAWQQAHPDSQCSQMRQQFDQWVTELRSGRWAPAGDNNITDVVNIGIGGSDLGPRLLVEAVASSGTPKVHFVANLDETEINTVLADLNPQNTLFVVISKSFNTADTLRNAELAKAWLQAANVDWASHMLAITANTSAAEQFGAGSILALPETIVGRYSMWSAVGFSAAVALGLETYNQFLAGAHAMDQHFLNADWVQNMPVILALQGIYYRDVLHADTQTIIPYASRLELLVAYLKQLVMESQGKSVTQDGELVDYATGPIIWGGVGTNTQHSFHQLLLQGTTLVPVDFIVPLKQQGVSEDCQRQMVANCLAQAQVMWHGADEEDLHKMIRGGHPSNMLVLPELNAFCLGALLALYEHKVYVQSVLWNINPFDQWAVEQGKILARQLADEFVEPSEHEDDVTHAVLELLRQSQG